MPEVITSRLGEIQARRAATDAAHERANRDAVLEHARMGRSVCEGTPDGGVIWIPPAEIFARYGLDEPTFLTAFTDPDTAAYTQAGFTAASQIGVTGFPTFVLRRGNQGTMLARGWAPYEQVYDAIQHALAIPA